MGETQLQLPLQEERQTRKLRIAADISFGKVKGHNSGTFGFKNLQGGQQQQSPTNGGANNNTTTNDNDNNNDTRDRSVSIPDDLPTKARSSSLSNHITSTSGASSLQEEMELSTDKEREGEAKHNGDLISSLIRSPSVKNLKHEVRNISLLDGEQVLMRVKTFLPSFLFSSPFFFSFIYICAYNYIYIFYIFILFNTLSL